MSEISHVSHVRIIRMLCRFNLLSGNILSLGYTKSAMKSALAKMVHRTIQGDVVLLCHLKLPLLAQALQEVRLTLLEPLELRGLLR